MHLTSTIENLVGRRKDGREENVALFIDGDNIDRTCLRCGIELNFGKLYALIEAHARIRTAQYFLTPTRADPQHRLNRRLRWMQAHKYTVVSRSFREDEHGNAHPDAKTDMDTHLAVEVMDFVQQSAHPIDRVILMSGDGDFVPLVAKLRNRGIAVTVVSNVIGDNPSASRELRETASDFVDLLDPWFLEATTGVTEPVI